MSLLLAAATQAAKTASGVGSAAPSPPGLFGAVLALLLVLGLILGMAWVLKRLPGGGFRPADGLRVVASLAVGAKERVVVVEVNGQQLLLGVSPGGVRTLHRLPEPLPQAAAPALPNLRQLKHLPDFAQLLAQLPRWNRCARGLRLLPILLALSLVPALGWAQAAPAAPAAPAAQNAAPTLPSLPQVNVGKVGAQPVSLPLQTLLLMTAITLLPSMLLVLTAFTRITIVLGLLRQAMGTGQTPSNQVLMGLALFLTALVMMPVWEKAWGQGMSPYLNGQLDFQTAWSMTTQPLRAFMLAQVREADLMTFAGMAGNGTYSSPDAIPFPVLVASFVTSELKTAFEIGFLIFIPFVIIDLVVASVLMSMGMMMMSPMLVSAPFKILLFVLVDGWVLTVGTLAASFNGV